MREGGKNAVTKGKKAKKRIYSLLYSCGAPRSILQTVCGDVSKTSSAPSGDKSVIFDHLFSLLPSLGADGTLTVITLFPICCQAGPTHASFVRCYLRKWDRRTSLTLRMWTNTLLNLYLWSFNDLFENWVSRIDRCSFRPWGGSLIKKQWLKPFA